MRALRVGLVAALAAVVLLVPTAASAQVNQITLGTARLGPEGASVDVPVTVVCDVGYNIAFGDVSVAQSIGHKLSNGTGFFENDFPGVPCTGAPQLAAVVTVFNASSLAFKNGKASVTADVTVFNPDTFDLPTATVGPQPIQISKK